jgi:hypothetical protein
MGEEQSKLLAVVFIKEVQHPYWIANLVFMPKKNAKWWNYVDYTRLNKSYPKDPFPLN